MSPPSSSTSPGSVAESITTLVDWAVSLGATLHPSVEVYDDAQTGLSFRVKPSAPHPVQALEPIVQLPATLSLSYLDAVAQQRQQKEQQRQQDEAPFPEEVLAGTPPHVIGRLFLVREFLRGRSSFWWPYIQALPQPGVKNRRAWALPPFWDADEAELLDGTNVEVGIAKVRQDVQSEFAHARKLLSACAVRDSLLDEGLTADLYQWAYCIFASRSFRPSLVLLDACRKALPAGVAMDDFSMLLPLLDVGNHDMTVNVRWELDHEAEQCSLLVGKEHQPGEQVFNNYGFKTNAELLLGYGFMVPTTEALHNDYIHVRKRRSATGGPHQSSTGTPNPPSQDASHLSNSSNASSHEYLISLRPLAHPSTLLARRTRQSISLPPDLPLLGSFQHVQLEMVWDILCTLTTSPQRRLLMPVPTTGQDQEDQEDREPNDVDSFHRRLFFSGHVGASAREVLGQTVAIIQHQLLQELERLNETDVEVVDGDEADLTGNQRLALDYRARCRAVLEQVLEAIDGDDVFGDDE
ncbi:hypothetical protein E4U17_003804 [Claviceps sp. LM77 group G4]|nr:hypothetical protein E4U17_003804 [Claviceps sp. LM77 group G4]KAG6073424.1 hypothetical protein E4U33_002902 [Claviceps sp. LM78 group G4]KAG6084009.1 hypothetical protein E4U16_002829 [Claviceps sp. LM84 group G4]